MDGVSPGDRVAALTVVDAYSEYIYLKKYQLISVPKDLDVAELATIILNYIVAYQALHRKARVEQGDTVLVIGASGGVGTAFLQLGKLADLKMYGVASREKHHVLEEYGAIPIDYKTQDFVEFIHEHEPDGIDAIFDGMNGDNIKRGFRLLRRGGAWIHYGNPIRFKQLLGLLGKLIVYNLLPNGKKLVLYGTSTSKFGRSSYEEDWQILFELLAQRKIEPVIMKKFELLEAREANEVLESGSVVGNLVLVRD